MQKGGPYRELSRLRLALRHLLNDLRSALRVVFGRSPLVKGNVYELARKCGKPSCACVGGQLHRTVVLSWSEQGGTRLRSIPSERRAEVRQKSQEYLRFRRARARVTEIYREMLKVIDRIEELRRQAP
jgi:hypothetical protein